MTIKILIADDHPLVREGIRFVLDRIDKKINVAETSTFPETLNYIRQHDNVSMLMLDLCMPGMNNSQSLLEILKIRPAIFVIIVSATDNIQIIHQLIKHGAKGYIHKSSDNEVMLNAIRLVLAGGLYLPPQWLNQLSDATISSREILTQRQQQIISLLATGKANKEIANEFSISDKTVKAHLSEIFKRLNAGNRTQAVHRAKQLGLLTDIT